MALDGIYLHLLKNEISDRVTGCRVDKIYQPSKDEILFTFRTRNGTEKLLLSAKADCARIQFTSAHIENPKKPPMLTMLLRKLLCGGVLKEIRQDGFERILTLVFDCRNDLGDPVIYNVIIEIMGRYSNIIITDENDKIIECIKRIDALKSSVRQILPGLKYALPPAQHKMNILTDDVSDIENAMAASHCQKRSKAAQEVLQGISPIVAREIEYGKTLTELKNDIQYPIPTVVMLDGPKDFTFFEPKQYDGMCQLKTFDDFSSLIDYFYYEQVRHDRIKQRSNDLFKHLTTLKERAVRKAINRQNELEECKDKDKFRIYGDIITANAYALKKGSFFYDLQNFYDNNAEIRIPADPTLSPSQNAQKYYKEYRKKQVAESKLNDFIAEAEDEAAYLESVIDSLSRAESDSEITAIRTELYESGFLSKRGTKNNKQKKLPPKKYISSEGFTIYVGRNNVQNDQLTLKTAKNYDLWFHVKDAAGSHVIVTAVKDKPFTDTLIRQAAMLAAHNSKASGSSNVAVDYTIVKNVHKPNGAKPGMVIYDNYNTEYVTPNEEELSEVTEIE
ncbi:MAG: NFACT RNA binding domain-containing protein [Eubacterium sp.]|nr:NFACT family protein [Oscillospiraceae bacterium]MDY4607561.1 NFACT RNA binding domain-containing protein [Eubacterium sp.]